MLGGSILGSVALGNSQGYPDSGLRVIFGDEDRTGKVAVGALSISESLGSRSSCQIRLIDRTQAWHVAPGTAVYVLFHGARMFAGTVEEVTESTEGEAAVNFVDVACVDFSQIFDRFYVAATYIDATLKEIVTDIVTVQTQVHLEGVSLAAVQDGPLIAKATFNYRTVAEAFKDLAETTGYAWRIDAHKILHFFDRATYTAPWAPGDGATKSYIAASYQKSRDRYRNKQWLRAGVDLTTTRTETFRGDDSGTEPEKKRRTFSLSYPVGEIVEIRKDSNVQRVGIKGVDKDDDLTVANWAQWFYQKGSHEISQNAKEDQASNPTLTSTEVLHVVYKGQFPLLVSVTNGAQVTERQSVEGGTGVYEHLESDEAIDGRDLASVKAARLLELYGRIPATLSWSTKRHGLTVGQLHTTTLAAHGVSGVQFLIDSIGAQWVQTPGGSAVDEFFLYAVQSLDGERQEGWADFFRKWILSGKKFVIRENESVLIVRDQIDQVTISDAWTDSVNNGTALKAYTEDHYTSARMSSEAVGGRTIWGAQMGRSTMSRIHAVIA